ncbi:FecR family protein [Sphingomonas silueang]|uniref:FecR family protein n=1 Tax=Sphingomonas silueang TaxID=3156617 RepID=UPI0032B4E1EE
MADDSVIAEAADRAERVEQLDAAGRAELHAWLARSPAHVAAFDRFRRLLADPALFDAAACEPAPPPPPPPPPPAVRRTVRRSITVARRVRRSAMAVAAGVAALLLAPTGWRMVAPAPTRQQEYASAVAQPRTIALPDGSQMTLDAASRVAIAFGGTRDLSLAEGAARFDVRHDADRPFRVHVGDTTMTALGTVFSAERLTGSSELRVFRGRVRLDVPGQAPVVVDAGRYARIGADGITLRMIGDTDRTAWRDRWLDGDAIPLATALTRLQRYSVVPIRLADPALGTLPITGRFRLDGSGQSLRLIASLYDLRVVPDRGALCLASDRYPRCAPHGTDGGK